MFDFEQVGRDELAMAFGAGVGIALASFAADAAADLPTRVLSVAVLAAVASLTVLLFAALE